VSVVLAFQDLSLVLGWVLVLDLALVKEQALAHHVPLQDLEVEASKFHR
jgi:hypothetical protein